MSDISFGYYPAQHRAEIHLRNGKIRSPILLKDFTKFAHTWVKEFPYAVESHVVMEADDWAQRQVLKFVLPHFLSPSGLKRRRSETLAFTIEAKDGKKTGKTLLNRLNHRRAPGRVHQICRISKKQVVRWLDIRHVTERALRKHIAETGVECDHDIIVPIADSPIRDVSPQIQKLFLIACLIALTKRSNIETVALVPWKEMTVLKLLSRR